jgi:methylenetetrahydrofolate reductase (NADPH)
MSAVQRIDEKIAALDGSPFVSFEFYPPRNEEGVKQLYERMNRFKEQGPSFFDFTWGAGGSTSDLTLELTKNSQDKYNITTNMHLTCTNMEATLVTKALDECKAHGIRNIVALRGDPPHGEEKWEAVEGGFTCALDLVKCIRDNYGNDYFCVSVAGYPEGHPNVIKKIPQSQVELLSEKEKGRLVTLEEKFYVCNDEDYSKELEYLKQKVDAGANMIITQMFFDAEVYIQFVKDCRAIGIDVPILPGIMCVQHYAGFKRMLGFCKTRVPSEVHEAFVSKQDDKKAMREYSIELVTSICKKLLEFGVPGLHFYTLNLEKVVMESLKRLNMYKTIAPNGSNLTELKGNVLGDSSSDLKMMKGTILSDSFDTSNV